MSKIFEDLKKDINKRIDKMSEKEKNNPSSNTYGEMAYKFLFYCNLSLHSLQCTLDKDILLVSHL